MSTKLTPFVLSLSDKGIDQPKDEQQNHGQCHIDHLPFGSLGFNPNLVQHPKNHLFGSHLNEVGIIAEVIHAIQEELLIGKFYRLIKRF